MKTLVFLAVISVLPGWAAVTQKSICGAECDYTPNSSGVQAAVDACRSLNSKDPCIISIAGEITITTSIRLGGPCIAPGVPDKGCTQAAPAKWIIIRSSRISELPEGVRITPVDASKLAKIRLTSVCNGVFVIPPETTGDPSRFPPSHYILQGLELFYDGNGINYTGLVNIGSDPSASNAKARQYWQQPHTIVIDRCWLHGQPFSTWTRPHGLQNGVHASGRDITIRNTRIDDINMDAGDRGHGETSGIFASNATGPWYLFNNYVDAAIGTLTGGESPWIPGLVMTGYYVFGSVYTRNPQVWHWIDNNTPGLDATKPCETGSYYEERYGARNKYECIAGAWQITGTVRNKRNWTKNGLECKNCRLVEWEGNVVENIPNTSDQSQRGHAFLINHVDSGYARWTRPEHITIRNNLVRRTGNGLIIGRMGSPDAYAETTDIVFENNLLENVGYWTVDPGGFDDPAGQLVDYSRANNLVIRRNTWVYGKSAGGGIAFRNAGPQQNVVIEDNISSGIVYGNGPLYGEGCKQFLGNTTGAVYFRNIGLVRSDNLWSLYYGVCNTVSHVTSMDDVRFVNANGGENGDYRLCTGSGTPDPACRAASPWATAASDGGALGADVNEVSWATNGVESGSADLQWWNFRIRRAEKSEIRYTAYDATACEGIINDSAGATRYRWADSGGSNRDRAIVPPGLSNGVYTVRVTCGGGRWRQEAMKIY